MFAFRGGDKDVIGHILHAEKKPDLSLTDVVNGRYTRFLD